MDFRPLIFSRVDQGPSEDLPLAFKRPEAAEGEALLVAKARLQEGFSRWLFFDAWAMEEEASAPPAAPSSVAERKGVDVEQPTSEGRPLEEERPLEHEVEKALLILSSQIEGAFPGHSSEAKANIFKEEPGPTQKEESLSDGALDFSFSALGGDLVAEETLSEESFFRGNSFVPQASRRFLDSQAERFLLLGTANFLSALGK